MEIDSPHKLGFGGVWWTLDEVGRFLDVVVAILRSRLLSVKIWRRLNVFYELLIDVLLFCSLQTILSLGWCDASIGREEAWSFQDMTSIGRTL